jgi:hypothetical protein
MEWPSWQPDTLWGWQQPEMSLPMVTRVDDALEEIHERCAASLVEEDQWMAELSALAVDEVTLIIIEACVKHGVTPDELVAEMSESQYAR